jgi:hypothetical protein
MSADIQKTPHHGEPDPKDSPTHPSAGYEKTDAHAGDTYRAGLYILGTMFLVAAVLVPAYRFLVRQEARTQPTSAYVVRETAKPPEGAFPRLVTSEPAALAEYRKKEDEVLAGWGWVEKDRGIARMPVSEAIKIVGERGTLPAFPAAAAAAAVADVAAKPGAGGRR